MNNQDQSLKKVEENEKFLLPEVEKKYDQYFDKITELKVGDIITHPQCKLCNHPLRAEAEAKWEQTKGGRTRGSYTLVIKFLNEHAAEHGGITFKYQNVSVHLNHHYEQQLKRLWLREYGRHLADIMNYKTTKDEMFEALIQAQQLKLFETAANPELDPIKQADTMVKLNKAILETSIVQAKFRGDIDTIDIYKEKFHRIIVNYITNEKDPVRHRELIEQLDLAKNEIQGV